MLERISKHACSRLIKKGVIEEADRDIYEYAIYCLLLSSLPIIWALIGGCILGVVFESVFFILPFICMRRYAGGYHAKKSWICFIWSMTLLATGLYSIKYGMFAKYDICIMVVSMIFSAIISPIDSVNKPLSFQEKKYCKKVLIIIDAFFLLLFLVLKIVKASNLTNSIAVGTVLVVALQIPCILKEIVYYIKNALVN